MTLIGMFFVLCGVGCWREGCECGGMVWGVGGGKCLCCGVFVCVDDGLFFCEGGEGWFLESEDGGLWGRGGGVWWMCMSRAQSLLEVLISIHPCNALFFV